MKGFNWFIHKKSSTPKSVWECPGIEIKSGDNVTITNCSFPDNPKGGDLHVIMPDWKPDPSRPPREHPDGTTD